MAKTRKQKANVSSTEQYDVLVANTGTERWHRYAELAFKADVSNEFRGKLAKLAALSWFLENDEVNYGKEPMFFNAPEDVIEKVDSDFWWQVWAIAANGSEADQDHAKMCYRLFLAAQFQDSIED